LAGRTHVSYDVGACGCSGESALGAVEEATAEAAKHGGRSSQLLAALVAEAKGLIEQTRAVQAERARAAAEAAAAAAAVAAVERLKMEEEMAALALTVQSDTLRVRSNALRIQQVQAQLGVPPAAPAPHPDDAEDQCVCCASTRPRTTSSCRASTCARARRVRAC
jgi:hypothetical protein